MDAISLAIGTSGLISVVDKISQLSSVAHNIRSFPKDMAEIVMQIDFEKQKANVWCIRVTLRCLEYDKTETDYADGSVQSIVHGLLTRCTDGVSSALEEVDVLAAKYLSERLREDIASNFEHSPYKAGRMKLEEMLKRGISTRRKILYVARPWAQPHKEELAGALERLKYWNTELAMLLNQQDLNSLRLESSTTFFSAIKDDEEVLRVLAKTAEDNDTPLSARLALQVVQTESTTPTTYHPWHKPGLAEESLSQTKMVDWLDCSGLTLGQREIAESRINALCALLNTTMPRGLPTFKPLGYGFSAKKDCFWILSEPKRPVEKIFNLHQILGTTHSVRLPLGDRFSLARRLCHAFLKLHESNWLHRGFNSTCVSFSVDPEDGKHEFLAITGFQYARPSDINEVSLPVTQKQRALTLYHHPDIRNNHKKDSGPTYVRYQAEHDLFSLAVVLLEIGIWMRISDLKTKSPIHEKTGLRNFGKAHLPHLMGAQYAQIVDTCFQGPRDDGISGSDSEIKGMLYNIVKPMEFCHCGLSPW